jgi:hypothetical protein
MLTLLHCERFTNCDPVFVALIYSRPQPAMLEAILKPSEPGLDKIPLRRGLQEVCSEKMCRRCVVAYIPMAVLVSHCWKTDSAWQAVGRAEKS